MITIKVKPDNPGQVLACCGIFELAEFLARGNARFSEENGTWKFLIRTPISLQDVVAFLKQSELELQGENPRESPLVLKTPKGEKLLNWWWNPILTGSGRLAKVLKGWGGKVSHYEYLDLFIQNLPDYPTEDLLEYRPQLRWPRKSSRQPSWFEFDSKLFWTGRDLGFSADETNFPVSVSPAIEAFAFIGLQTFRPKPAENAIQYCIWRWEIPIEIARVAYAGDVDADLVKFEAKVAMRGQGYKALKPGRRI